MTQDEIIEMAIQGHASTRDAIRWAMNQEREACAQIVNDDPELEVDDAIRVMRAIRARGQA